MPLMNTLFNGQNPEIFLLHRGVVVFFDYKDDDEEALTYHYRTDDGEFDVRNLCQSANINDRDLHADVIRDAIDRQAGPFQGEVLDRLSAYALSDIEQQAYQALNPDDPVPGHIHALYNALEGNPLHQALFQALREHSSAPGWRSAVLKLQQSFLEDTNTVLSVIEGRRAKEPS
jgi:hypothetical protein